MILPTWLQALAACVLFSASSGASLTNHTLLMSSISYEINKPNNIEYKIHLSITNL